MEAVLHLCLMPRPWACDSMFSSLNLSIYRSGEEPASGTVETLCVEGSPWARGGFEMPLLVPLTAGPGGHTTVLEVETPLGLAITLPFIRIFFISFHYEGSPGKEEGRKTLLVVSDEEADGGPDRLSDLSTVTQAVAEVGFEFQLVSA